MKTKVFAIPLLAISLSATAIAMDPQGNEKISPQLQARLLKAEAQQTVPLFIYFKDKGENIEQKLIAAKAALSPRALARRTINRGADNAVSFSDVSIHPDYLKLLKSKVVKVRHQLKALNAVSVEATPDAINDLALLDFVARIEIVNQLSRKPVTQDPQVMTDSSLNNLMMQESEATTLDYGDSLTQLEQIYVPAVHDMGYSGSGVVIAIFDTGFNRLSHESFAQINIAGAWDFVNNDDDVADQLDMGIGAHGTNTLSTIGGYSPGKLIGPAYGATYYLAKTENTDSELHVEEDNWCAAAEWADDNGAQIITSSLGYNVFDSGGDYAPSDMDGNTTVVTKCAEIAAANGIVVINSAGNDGPGSGENTLGAPSDGKAVLAVGAVQASGQRSSFSSVGPSADGRIKPDVMAMGTAVHVASTSSDTSYANFNGTSFSCPLTAGVAALVLEANPALTAEQVRDILRNSADLATMPNNLYGYGIIDAQKAVEAAVQASSGNIAPHASFAVLTNELTASFTNLSSDSDGTIDSYLWDFGDSASTTEQHPSHLYASTGTYVVSLTVTDNEGLSETISQNVTVTSTRTPEGDDVGNSSRSSGGGSLGFGLIAGLLLFIRRSRFF